MLKNIFSVIIPFIHQILMFSSQWCHSTFIYTCTFSCAIRFHSKANRFNGAKFIRFKWKSESNSIGSAWIYLSKKVAQFMISLIRLFSLSPFLGMHVCLCASVLVVHSTAREKIRYSVRYSIMLSPMSHNMCCVWILVCARQ